MARLSTFVSISPSNAVERWFARDNTTGPPPSQGLSNTAVTVIVGSAVLVAVFIILVGVFSLFRKPQRGDREARPAPTKETALDFHSPGPTSPKIKLLSPAIMRESSLGASFPPPRSRSYSVSTPLPLSGANVDLGDTRTILSAQHPLLPSGEVAVAKLRRSRTRGRVPPTPQTAPPPTSWRTSPEMTAEYDDTISSSRGPTPPSMVRKPRIPPSLPPSPRLKASSPSLRSLPDMTMDDGYTAFPSMRKNRIQVPFPVGLRPMPSLSSLHSFPEAGFDLGVAKSDYSGRTALPPRRPVRRDHREERSEPLPNPWSVYDGQFPRRLSWLISEIQLERADEV